MFYYKKVVIMVEFLGIIIVDGLGYEYYGIN